MKANDRGKMTFTPYVKVVTRNYCLAESLAYCLSKDLHLQEYISYSCQPLSHLVIREKSFGNTHHYRGVLVTDLDLLLNEFRTDTQLLETLLSDWRTLGIGRTHTDILYLVSAGLRGWVSDDSGIREVYKAVEALRRGGYWFDPPRGKSFSLLAHKFGEAHFTARPNENFSQQEASLLLLLSYGLTSPQIADILPYAIGTVRNKLCFLYKKLGVRCREKAVEEAKRRNLLIPSI